MNVTCDRCCVYIEGNNRRWPGFCSSACRDDDRRARDQAAVDLAQRRAEVRRQREAARGQRGVR